MWRRDYAFRQRSSKVPDNYLPLEEAQLILAQDTGFGGWPALQDAVRSGTPRFRPSRSTRKRTASIRSVT